MYAVHMIEMSESDFKTVLDALRYFHEMTGDDDVEKSLELLEEAQAVMERYA